MVTVDILVLENEKILLFAITRAKNQGQSRIIRQERFRQKNSDRMRRGVSWFSGNGQWQDKNYEPSAGDIIFFDWDNDGITDHVGIVEKCENGIVYTVRATLAMSASKISILSEVAAPAVTVSLPIKISRFCG